MGKIENDARLGIYLKTMLDWVLQLKTMLDGSLAVNCNRRSLRKLLEGTGSCGSCDTALKERINREVKTSSEKQA